MEALASGGLLAGEYGDYDHVAVAPAGMLALFGAAAGVAFAIDRNGRGGHDSGAAVAARELLRFSLLPVAAAVFAMQLATLLVCENVEHLSAFGTLSDGAGWLGGPVLCALAVHGLIALAVTALLRGSLRSILTTCDRLYRAAAGPLRIAPPRAARVTRLFEIIATPRSSKNILACSRGLRAPPRIPFAARH